MALDHARDFFGFTTFDPTDPAETTPGLFLTRWITHFCAPVFVFLAGLGVALSATKGKPRYAIARSLFLRGCWLIFLEFTVIRAAWFLGFAADVTFRFAFVQVIWALGLSMIFLAALLALSIPRWIMFAISAAIALGHNALDHLTPDSFGSLSALWKVLHVAEPIHWGWGATESHVLLVKYPLLPWPAVMVLGYLFAPILALPPERQRRICLTLGLSLTLAFIALRAINLYADPNPWQNQQSTLFTFLSFINTTKYPPSLCYLLMTLGPAIAILPFLDRLPCALRRPIATFGKVPMFFYITHLYLLQLGGIASAYARYGPDILQLEGWPPPDFYQGLAPIYLAWALAVLILHFPCRWYARMKHRHPARWHWLL